MLICFEGIDGSGKSTIAEEVAQRIDANVLTFPRYDSPTGILIKDYLRGAWDSADSGLRVDAARTFQSLNIANRMEVMPQLYSARGHARTHLVVVRYWQSGWVYGQMDGLEPQWLLDVNGCMAMPDISFLVDVASATALKRQQERDPNAKPERYEGTLGKLETAKQLYAQLWDRPVRGRGPHIRIDGHLSVDACAEQVMRCTSINASINRPLVER